MESGEFQIQLVSALITFNRETSCLGYGKGWSELTASNHHISRTAMKCVHNTDFFLISVVYIK